jgi:hypothetical protein
MIMAVFSPVGRHKYPGRIRHMAMRRPQETARNKMIRELRLRLAEGLVDVELDIEHYHYAIDKALERYRQRSSNAVEESFAFLDLQPGQSQYVLPSEVILVRQIHRRGIGGQSTGGGTALDPFAAAYTNMYLLQGGQQGGLLTFELFSEQQELVGRMFGVEINFTYNPNSHTLWIMRQITSPEQVLLWLYNQKPEEVLLSDIYARPWLSDYALAHCKTILGHAYSKFATIVGPQGGTGLNGDALKSDADQMFEKLEQDLSNYCAGETPLSFTIG